MVDRNRPARYTVGDRAALKATGQPVQILEARRGEFIPDYVYKVRVLAEKPARPYNLSVPEHDLSDRDVHVGYVYQGDAGGKGLVYAL